MKDLLGIPRRIAAISRNTFIEAARNRAFVGLGIAAMGLVASSMAVSSLAIADQMARVLIDFGLFAISLLEVVIAVTMGVILVYKEVDKKTFYLVLSKPIRRSEVLAGKFFGLVGVLAIAVLLMTVAWVGSLILRSVPLKPDMPQALVLAWLQAVLITSVALFFSSFSSPILSGVFTLGVYLAGSSVPVLNDLLSLKKGALASSEAARFVAQTATAVLPDLSIFNVGKELILGIPISWGYVGAAGAYCLGWCLLFFGLACLIFERRDFA
jgi:ABC-type transport system involved in multi-copper enzyme maturation permease subunit